MNDNKRRIGIGIIVGLSIVSIVFIALSWIYESKVLFVVRDLLATLTITFSVALNINFNITINNTKNIYNVVDNKDNKLEEKDHEILKELKSTVEPLIVFFKDKDFTFTLKNGLFDDLFELNDIILPKPMFRFSDNNLNKLLSEFKESIVEFIGCYLENIIPYAGNLIVSKRKYEMNKGTIDASSKKYLKEDRELMETLNGVFDAYKKIVKEFHNLYTPHKSR